MSVARQRADFVRTTGRGIGEVNSAVAGITAEELGNGITHRTILNLNRVPITVANTTGVSFGGVKLYDFPAGTIAIKGVALLDLAIGLTNAGNATPITGAMGGDVALGSVVNNDATMTSTNVDLLPSTSIDPISGGVTHAILAAPTFLGSRAAALDMFFNMLIDDADVADTASDILELSGTIVVEWSNLHDLGE